MKLLAVKLIKLNIVGNLRDKNEDVFVRILVTLHRHVSTEDKSI